MCNESISALKILFCSNSFHCYAASFFMHVLDMATVHGLICLYSIESRPIFISLCIDYYNQHKLYFAERV